MDPGLTIDTVLSDGLHTRLRVSGELDIATVDLLEDELGHELSVGHRFVGVDMTAVSFCDLCGVRMLENVDGRFRRARGRLTLFGGEHRLGLVIEARDEGTSLILRAKRPPRPIHQGAGSSVLMSITNR